MVLIFPLFCDQHPNCSVNVLFCHERGEHIVKYKKIPWDSPALSFLATLTFYPSHAPHAKLFSTAPTSESFFFTINEKCLIKIQFLFLNMYFTAEHHKLAFLIRLHNNPTSNTKYRYPWAAHLQSRVRRNLYPLP
jgi:hypothetical protein